MRAIFANDSVKYQYFSQFTSFRNCVVQKCVYLSPGMVRQETNIYRLSIIIHDFGAISKTLYFFRENGPCRPASAKESGTSILNQIVGPPVKSFGSTIISIFFFQNSRREPPLNIFIFKLVPEVPKDYFSCYQSLFVLNSSTCSR